MCIRDRDKTQTMVISKKTSTRTWTLGKCKKSRKMYVLRHSDITELNLITESTIPSGRLYVFSSVKNTFLGSSEIQKEIRDIILEKEYSEKLSP